MTGKIGKTGKIICLLLCIMSQQIAAQGILRFPAATPSYQGESGFSPSLLHCKKGPYLFDLGVLVRGYYLNDQRIQWSGNEETMGVEGILTPSIIIDNRTGSSWSAHGEFLLQDTLNDNAYIGNSERLSYLRNYNDQAFQIAQLHIRYKNPLFEFRAGKFESPFGNYTMPLMSNSRWDAPFIRTESILWRDTGMLFRFTPSVFDACIAVTNGCEGLDTNSMKAVIGRLGLNFPSVTLGISGLYQDGVGSEEQKQYRRHAGVDASVRHSNWVLSSEIIYDEYGMYHDFDPNDIFWKKSIYYRQINKAEHVPITGWGGYVDLTYYGHPWLLGINYGEYYPEQLRNPYYRQHDIINRRFLLKAGWNFTQHVQWYSALLLETEGYTAQCSRTRRGWAVMSGVKMEL